MNTDSLLCHFTGFTSLFLCSKLCLAESSQDTNSTDGVAAEPRVNFRKLLDRLKELAKFESSDDDFERADIEHKREAVS